MDPNLSKYIVALPLLSEVGIWLYKKHKNIVIIIVFIIVIVISIKLSL